MFGVAYNAFPLSDSYAPNTVYAPRPSRGPAPTGFAPPHNYPPADAQGPYLQTSYHNSDPSSITLASTSSSYGAYKEGRVTADYRGAMNRTPSPTPSEVEVLTTKSRSCDLRGTMQKYLNYEWLRQPRNLGAYTFSPAARRAHVSRAVTFIITILVIGGLIAFVALQNKIIDALRPAQHWLLTYVHLASFCRLAQA